MTNDTHFIEEIIALATKHRVQHLQVGDVTVVLHPTAWFPPDELAEPSETPQAEPKAPVSLQEELGNPELSESDLYGASDQPSGR